jgi:hypothetical protein
MLCRYAECNNAGCRYAECRSAHAESVKRLYIVPGMEFAMIDTFLQNSCFFKSVGELSSSVACVIKLLES